jgi:hypothetical protein
MQAYGSGSSTDMDGIHHRPYWLTRRGRTIRAHGRASSPRAFSEEVNPLRGRIPTASVPGSKRVCLKSFLRLPTAN